MASNPADDPTTDDSVPLSPSEIPPEPESEPESASSATGDLDDRGFLRLLPLTVERVARALDAVGYDVEDSPTPTVFFPHFRLSAAVAPQGGGILHLRFEFRRAHPLFGYGMLLAIANDVNRTRLALKAHVAAANSTSTPNGSDSPLAEGSPTQVASYFVVESEVPFGTGVADVQLYDVLVHAIRGAEGLVTAFPSLAVPSGTTSSSLVAPPPVTPPADG